MSSLPDNLQGLRVVDLKELLTKRGLSASGRKAELIARLEEVRELHVLLPQDSVCHG